MCSLLCFDFDKKKKNSDQFDPWQVVPRQVFAPYSHLLISTASAVVSCVGCPGVTGVLNEGNTYKMMNVLIQLLKVEDSTMHKSVKSKCRQLCQLKRMNDVTCTFTSFPIVFCLVRMVYVCVCVCVSN